MSSTADSFGTPVTTEELASSLILRIGLISVRNTNKSVKDSKILARLQKNIRFDFDDELKIGDVRYKHLTKITIKVQLV